MAEKIEEEPIDNSIDSQTENNSDKIISITEKDEIITNQETENMEVHHHPDLHHKPKKWKEYLLEGLMIFIAVTLGFFAEQLREHYVEIKIEKVYVQSLYNDLKIDTLVIQRTIDEKKWIYQKFDRAQTILTSNDIKNNNEYLYYVEKFVIFNDVFTSQDITYQQLKSSGGFRYLKNIELYKKIADYYNLYSRYQDVGGKFGASANINEVKALETKIFNLKDLSSLDNYNTHNFYDLALIPNNRKFELIKSDQQSINQLYQNFNTQRTHAYQSKLILGWLKDQATILLNELKKEYSLE